MSSGHVYTRSHTRLVRAAHQPYPITRDVNLAVSELDVALGAGRKAVPWAQS